MLLRTFQTIRSLSLKNRAKNDFYFTSQLIIFSDKFIILSLILIFNLGESLFRILIRSQKIPKYPKIECFL